MELTQYIAGPGVGESPWRIPIEKCSVEDPIKPNWEDGIAPVAQPSALCYHSVLPAFRTDVSPVQVKVKLKSMIRSYEIFVKKKPNRITWEKTTNNNNKKWTTWLCLFLIDN